MNGRKHKPIIFNTKCLHLTCLNLFKKTQSRIFDKSKQQAVHTHTHTLQFA